MFENLYNTIMGDILMGTGVFFISLVIYIITKAVLAVIEDRKKGNNFLIVMQSDNIDDLKELKYYMEQRRDMFYGDREDSEIMINSCDKVLEAVNKKINSLEGK